MINDKPSLIGDNNFVNGLYEKILTSKAKGEVRSTINSIEFADVHLDLAYTQGTPTLCVTVICCRPVKGFTTLAEGDPGAGKWGTYSCDLPKITF